LQGISLCYEIFRWRCKQLDNLLELLELQKLSDCETF